MTQIERLVAAGEVPEEFLREEDRMGYTITTDNKKLWALQIDLMKQAERLCERHGLKYFAMGGTLIGAIRHKGFIPWDDDLDIMLSREDYEKFIGYAQTELEAPYFLQSPLTDKHFFREHVLLRNSETTCIGKWDARAKCNNGVYIDIFPMDGWEDTDRCRAIYDKAKKQNKFGMNNYRWASARNARVKRLLGRLASLIRYPGGSAQIYREHEKLVSEMFGRDLPIVGVQYTHFVSKRERAQWKKEDFADTVRVPYEYTDICIPVGWKDVLTTSFGDYMKLPPVESRGNKHSLEYAPDVPYRTYCAEKYGVKYDD